MADTTLPTISFPAEIRGSGTFFRGDRRGPAARFSLVRDTYSDAEPWRFASHVDTSDAAAFSAVHLSGRGVIEFRGTTDTGHAIRTTDLLIRQASEHFNGPSRQSHGITIEGELYTFDRGDDELPWQPTEQWIMVHFTDTPLALQQFPLMSRKWTGEVVGEFDPLPPFLISSAFGAFEFSRTFVYENAAVTGRKAAVSIAQPALQGSIAADCLATTTSALMDSLDNELFDLCRVLSFLSRQRVDRTRIEIISIGPESDTRITERRRVASFSQRHGVFSPLVMARALGPNDLNSMYHRFRSLDLRERGYSIIGFLLASHDSRGSVEDRVSSAFTALEALAAAVTGDDRILSDDQFDALRDLLKPTIKQFCVDQGLPSEARAAMYAKLRELQRPPIVKRIADVFTTHGIEWQDIWPNSTDLVTPLKEAYDRRSLLVHTGTVPDFHAAVDDYERIHALTERLFFHLIGGEDRWVDSQAYSHLRR